MFSMPALILAAALTLQPADTGVIEITFDVGSGDGAVMAALFDSQSAYDDGGAPVRSAMVNVAGGERVARFEGLPPGDYALRAFHDVNGDGRMNTNPFGMPSEPFAFSNNAVGNMGPASWDRARFAVTGETRQTITLR
jgi:uncharacterized protein (DUF2141 family)